MNIEVKKWLRPPEKIIEKVDCSYDSLDKFFLGDDDNNNGFMNFYDIENDNSWVNDVFAVELVKNVENGQPLINSDFSNITLSGAVLQGAVLAGSAFVGGVLVGVDFFGSNLEGVDFTACDLRNVDFRKCNLKNAIFSEANLAGAVFDDADVSGAVFKDAYVLGAKLGSAVIDEKAKSEFEQMMEIIEEAQNGKIPLHQLPQSILQALDWKRMFLGGVDLSNIDFTGISLIGVNMAGTMQRVLPVVPTYDYDKLFLDSQKQEDTPQNIPIPVQPELKISQEIFPKVEEYQFINFFNNDQNEKKETLPEKETIQKEVITNIKPQPINIKQQHVEKVENSNNQDVDNKLNLLKNMQKRLDKKNNSSIKKRKGNIRV